MILPGDLESAVSLILEKYRTTPLVERWREAISFGSGVHASAYWIRDSADAVNVVWIASDGIRDITLVPGPPTFSMFDFLPKRSISSIGTREAENAGRNFRFPASGDFLVLIFTTSDNARIGLVADTEDQKHALKAFAQQIMLFLQT